MSRMKNGPPSRALMGLHPAKRYGRVSFLLGLVFGGSVFVSGIYFVLYSFYGLWVKEFIISGTAVYFATIFMVGAILLFGGSLFTGWLMAHSFRK